MKETISDYKGATSARYTSSKWYIHPPLSFSSPFSNQPTSFQPKRALKANNTLSFLSR